MKILIEKGARRLTVPGTALSFPIALGREPVGEKNREGDGRTPEGIYFVCLKKIGKYGPSLGVSYPNAADARRNHAENALIAGIEERAAAGLRPPWGSFLGGEIYIHGGGVRGDWTQGCIALEDGDARALYDLVPVGAEIEIRA